MDIYFQYPEKLGLFFNDFESRYLVAYGGRSSAKSWTACRAGLQRNFRFGDSIVVFRDFNSSLDESAFKIFKNTIEEFELQRFYKINEGKIINLVNDSRILFKGYDRNTVSVKGLEKIKIAIIEEGETLKEDPFDIIDGTLRLDGSQIFIMFNPFKKEDFVFKHFITNQIEGSNVVKVNYCDNPWVSETTILQADRMKRRNYQRYLWMYKGEPLELAESMVFAEKITVQNFDIPDEKDIFRNRFFYGVDWGFSIDPTAAIKCFIKDNYLYISNEVYKTKISNSDLPSFIRGIPDIDSGLIYADSARPEHIDECQKAGLSIYPVNKSKMYEQKYRKDKGNKVTFIRAFIDFILDLEGIIIHPRCENTIAEFMNYSYKVDSRTNEIFPEVANGQKDHLIDATRYALSQIIRGNVGIEELAQFFN